MLKQLFLLIVLLPIVFVSCSFFSRKSSLEDSAVPNRLLILMTRPADGDTGVACCDKITVFVNRGNSQFWSQKNIFCSIQDESGAQYCQRIVPWMNLIELEKIHCLDPGKLYTVSLKGLEDEYGNKAEDKSWSFRTGQQ